METFIDQWRDIGSNDIMFLNSMIIACLAAMHTKSFKLEKKCKYDNVGKFRIKRKRVPMLT